MELAHPSATAAERQALSYEELIRSHAAGKHHAVERYDAMLWKIRTGYIVALYGALTLLGDSALALPWLSGLIIAAFSVSALGIDYLFLRSRLRVVHAQNALAELAWDLAGGRALEAPERERLRRLLRISGEDPILDPEAKAMFWRGGYHWLFLLLYLLPPVLALLYGAARLAIPGL